MTLTDKYSLVWCFFFGVIFSKKKVNATKRHNVAYKIAYNEKHLIHFGTVYLVCILVELLCEFTEAVGNLAVFAFLE